MSMFQYIPWNLIKDSVKPKEEEKCITWDEMIDSIEKERESRSKFMAVYLDTYAWCLRHIKNLYWDTIHAPHRFHQYVTRGFSDRQLWGLDWTIAKFIYPRLQAFRDLYDGDHVVGYQPTFDDNGEVLPNSYELWIEKLDKMLYSVKNLALNDDWDLPMPEMKLSEIKHGNPKYDEWRKRNDEHLKKMQEGFELLGKHMGALWW